MSVYLDKEGKVITLNIWTHYISDPGYFIIGRNFFPDGTLISTRWRGFPTRLFESVVFSKENEILDSEVYYTDEDAIEGHKRYLKKYNYM